MLKREEDENLYHWEKRVFEQESIESKKKWCRDHGRRSCNLECPRMLCDQHPEYSKSVSIN